ncbi:MAG TPA: endopeptidase La [Ruminiclostridium sp.]|nr:endopeptidase La [Ruminiclostridium sp.]
MKLNDNGKIINIPLLPLRGLTVFPKMILNFDVGRKKSIEALKTAMSGNQMIFLVAQRDTREEDPKTENLFTIGTVAQIKQIVNLPGENVRVLIEGAYRARIIETKSEEPFFIADIEECKAIGRAVSSVRAQALIRKTQELVSEYSEIGPKLPQDILSEIYESKDIGSLSDYIASNILLNFEDKQYVLEELNPSKRIQLILDLLGNEVNILGIERDISEKVHNEIDKNQREYYIREQIKVLSQELDEDDNPKDEAEEYHERINKLHLGEKGTKAEIELGKEATEKMHQQADRLFKMPIGSHEATVVRTWLDTCLSLPWNKSTKDKLDLDIARKVLDNDHYGLDKVKDRIIEYIAVKKLSKNVSGQIICLVGPPGVGKTSVARSIAKAIGRKYVRVSLGGVRDEADIRGHRKTYIGAMPGRIINAIIHAGVSNPLLLLDEVDKLEGDFRGDPAAALLEVLDAEQNYAFRDHFVEIPFDLSHVMFLTTANTLETIPEPLLDRMEIISLSSYTREEKFNIAKLHLIEKELRKNGLNKRMLKINDATLYGVIDTYTREAGVRSLEREIGTLCRKTAKEIVSGKKHLIINNEDLEKLLGPKRFKPESILKNDEIGVVTGLAWTTVGGETMPVEVSIMDGSGKLELTGSLGDVMKESAKAAISYIRCRADDLGIAHDFYSAKDIHIHVPEGAIPKDGPSAGVTMATAVVSALLGYPVKRDVAMTGEITLRGRVLPIGGLKEKTMAAYRAGVKTVIIPEDNSPDLAEIDEVVKENIHFITANNMDTVLKSAIIFPEQSNCEKVSGETDNLNLYANINVDNLRPVISQ